MCQAEDLRVIFAEQKSRGQSTDWQGRVSAFHFSDAKNTPVMFCAPRGRIKFQFKMFPKGINIRKQDLFCVTYEGICFFLITYEGLSLMEQICSFSLIGLFGLENTICTQPQI